MEMIKCERCGKEIQKRGPRKFCIACRNALDKINNLEYRTKNRDIINERTRERARRLRAEKLAAQDDEW